MHNRMARRLAVALRAKIHCYGPTLKAAGETGQLPILVILSIFTEAACRGRRNELRRLFDLVAVSKRPQEHLFRRFATLLLTVVCSDQPIEDDGKLGP